MSARAFTDRLGVRWTVSLVDPETESGAPRERRAEPRSRRRFFQRQLTTRPLNLPSLCFESDGERRTTTRVPTDWVLMADDALEDLLSQTQRIP